MPEARKERFELAAVQRIGDTEFQDRHRAPESHVAERLRDVLICQAARDNDELARVRDVFELINAQSFDGLVQSLEALWHFNFAPAGAWRKQYRCLQIEMLGVEFE